jgi:hypothetical protein
MHASHSVCALPRFDATRDDEAVPEVRVRFQHSSFNSCHCCHRRFGRVPLLLLAAQSLLLAALLQCALRCPLLPQPLSPAFTDPGRAVLERALPLAQRLLTLALWAPVWLLRLLRLSPLSLFWFVVLALHHNTEQARRQAHRAFARILALSCVAHLLWALASPPPLLSPSSAEDSVSVVAAAASASAAAANDLSPVPTILGSIVQRVLPGLASFDASAFAGTLWSVLPADVSAALDAW